MCYNSKIVVDGKTFTVHECGGLSIQQIAPVQGERIRGHWSEGQRKAQLPETVPEPVVKAVENDLMASGRY